jgi:ERCC4-related helicase
VAKRKYQSNIFVTCSKTNCLVVVPTGLGKTVVALLLAIHRLSKDPQSKIIFLAPTRPLVAQHLRTFRELTTLDEDHLVELTGHIAPAKRQQLYESAECLFMTPQVLQNDLITNRTTLKDVSLLMKPIMHLAIMRMYFWQKNTINKRPIPKR